jgi:hypothetical protein
MSLELSAAAGPLPGQINLKADNLESTQGLVSTTMSPATAVPTATSLPAAPPAVTPLPVPRGRRAISLREVLLGHADLPNDVVEKIEARDRQQAIFPDGRGGMTTFELGVCDGIKYVGKYKEGCTEFGIQGTPCTRKKCEGVYKSPSLRMSPMAADWLNEDLRRHWFYVQGVSPYGGGEKGPQQKKPGQTSAYQNEDTGGWAQHKTAYNPSEEFAKQFKGAEARQNRMHIRGLK